MVCSTRIRISSRDKGGASDFLTSLTTLTILWIRDTSWRELFSVFFPRISLTAKELFLFLSFNRLFKNLSIFLTYFKLFGTGCTSQIAFFKVSVCIRCKLEREVLFKLMFIQYNVKPLGSLVFFLTLRARGMRKQ